jgi:hypothetical protein
MAELKLAVYAFFGASFAYFGIPAEAYWIMAALILVDTVTGSVRAIRVDARSFTSAALRNGVLAKLLLLLIPLIVAMVAKSIPHPLDAMAMNMVAASIGILAVSEAYSAIANIGAIIKKDGGPESDGVSFVISKILGLLRALLDALTKK